MSELYRDFIDGKADEIINSLGGTITPAPANAELYRDFLDRKFDDVINACNGLVKVKSFTYNGYANPINNITFPEIPSIVIIEGYLNNQNNIWSKTAPILWGTTMASSMSSVRTDNYSTSSGGGFHVSFNDKVMTIDSANNYSSMNSSGVTYTVYYI